MTIKTLNQVRFNALCYSRQPLAHAISKELEWFADEDERVLGIVLLDLVDTDWLWIVLGRDENNLFRAIDLNVSIPTQDEARKELYAKLHHYATGEKRVFAQGDERKHTIRLFDTNIPEERQNSIFKLIKSSKHYSSARAIMQEIAHAFIDVDGNYLKDFQTAGFNARLWELYLFAFFHEQRFIISREFDRPDFSLIKAGIPISVEAVTVNPTHGETAPSPDSEESLKLLREEYMPIKFGSALFSKLNKRYWDLPHVTGKPFILAIHDFHSNDSMTWSAPSLSDYLFGLRATWRKNKAGKLIVKDHRIQKHTWGKKVIPSGFFNQPGTENISAVIFANSGTIAKFNRMGKLADFGDPDVIMIRSGVFHRHDPNASEGTCFQMLVEPDKCHESWSESVTVFHNPNAVVPVTMELFPGCAHAFLVDGKRLAHTPEWFVHQSVTHVVAPSEEIEKSK